MQHADKYIQRIERRFSFTPEEIADLKASFSDVRSYPARETIVEEGEPMAYSTLLHEGYAARVKHTASGSRQIAAFHIPGDFVDLHSYPLECLAHSILAMTDCTIVRLPHENITRLIEKNARFARLLWFSTMVDASIHREWLLNIGRRKGAERLAHFLCETLCRSEIVRLAEGTSFPLPMTQADLADTLGFTPVHMNRIIGKLRDKGLARLENRTAHINNRKALEELAGFDPGYLYLQARTG